MPESEEETREAVEEVELRLPRSEKEAVGPATTPGLEEGEGSGWTTMGGRGEVERRMGPRLRLLPLGINMLLSSAAVAVALAEVRVVEMEGISGLVVLHHLLNVGVANNKMAVVAVAAEVGEANGREAKHLPSRSRINSKDSVEKVVDEVKGRPTSMVPSPPWSSPIKVGGLKRIHQLWLLQRNKSSRS